MSFGEGSNNERGTVWAELERLKRDNCHLRMRLSYLESENSRINTTNNATKVAKLSKWHRVKGALGWEKDKDDLLKVPNSSSDSPFSVSPAGSCLSHSPLGTHYALPVMPHLSSSSSDEDIHLQESRCDSKCDEDCKRCPLEDVPEAVQNRRSKSLDSEIPTKLELHIIDNDKKNEKIIKNEPHHRTPWSKVKCMIHHHSKVRSRKVVACCHQCDKKDDKWHTLSGSGEIEEECMLVKDSTPKLTVTLPSSEELCHDKDDKKHEHSSVLINHPEISPPLIRKSKWLKVREVFLQGSRSAPTSPLRSESFAFDMESDEVSSAEILDEKEEINFDDNENLRYEIEASYIELQNRLTDEFARKMEEIAHNSDIKHRFRVKKTGDSSRSIPQEIIVPTSTGLFRFEGISDKFTRRLYEWEVARGISAEESTFALLDPQYKPMPNKNKINLAEFNNGIVKSKSIGSIVDFGNLNQNIISHQRTSSLSLNDVDEIQASLVQVSEPKVENLEIRSNLPSCCNSPSYRNEEVEPILIDPYHSSDCEKETRNNINCRQVVDSSFQLLQENISLLDKLKKERDVCRQLEDDMIHLEGQIHNVSQSFKHEIADSIELHDNGDCLNLDSYKFGEDYHVTDSNLDLTIPVEHVYQMNSMRSSNIRMKLDQYQIDNFETEPKYNKFHQHDFACLSGNRVDSILIHSLIVELLELAEQLEPAVIQRDKEIFHLKTELYRKEMAVLPGNEIRSFFSSFTLPIHRLRGRKSQELSRLPKQIMDKLLELKQAFTLVNSNCDINISTPRDIGQPVLTPHNLRRCAGHEDLSPEPPVQPQSTSTASSPASSFSYHDSCNADESPNDWISVAARNQNVSRDISNSNDWLGLRDEHSSFTDIASEDGLSDICSLVNASNAIVPTTRKIFSPVGDSKVIEFVIGEDNSNNEKKMEESDVTVLETEPPDLGLDNDEMVVTATLVEAVSFESLEKQEPEIEDTNNNGIISSQNLEFLDCSGETKDFGIEELTLGEELSCSLKMRAMKIQKAKEEFLRGNRTGSLSIVVDSLGADVPNALMVKSASVTELSTCKTECEPEPNLININGSNEAVESSTKLSKLSLLGIFKRPKRRCKEGAIMTLARQSLVLSSEPLDPSQTKSCPSSPVPSKRNDSSWIKNPAKMIFRPKGKYMINNK